MRHVHWYEFKSAFTQPELATFTENQDDVTCLCCREYFDELARAREESK